MRPAFIDRLYPRASEPRPPIHHPEVRKHRIKFFKAALLNFCLLILLFISLYSYLFGALYQQETLVSNLKILWVDYDGDVIGEAIRDAYHMLQSDRFPTLVEQPPSAFPSESDLIEAVCSTDYWAALFTHAGASQTLGRAITGAGAAQYDRSNVLSYVWNEARYPAVVDPLISSNLQNLSDIAREAYVARNATAVFSTIPPKNLQAIAAFTNPWKLTPINIQATTQGTRTVYNTMAIVLMIIQDFFFLGTINGLYDQFQIYVRIIPERIFMFRYGFSLGFAMFASMLITAIFWAFKASWNVTGTQYALNWQVLWLFGHCNFLSLDVFTIWIPAPYVSMALITWVVINITSIIYPFELSSPFYQWAYALPAHAAYDALTDVWSHGCSPHLYYALPVLFAYELSGITLTGLGVYKRSHYAIIRASGDKEGSAAAEQEKKQSAAGDGRKPSADKDSERDRPEMQMENSSGAKESSVPRKEGGGATAEPESEQSGLQRAETRASQQVHFGPCFHVFGADDE